MENNNFRSIPTSLFLNGPKLSIVSNPQSITESAGVATFTGIATAIYEDPRFELDGGSVDIRWYFDGQRILDSSVDPNSRATIVGFNSTTGTGSTIIISNLDGNDNGKLVYFEADYIPAAYSYPVGSDVIAGTARSTANAFNEPLVSAGATLTARPLIVITKQPGIVSSFYNVENTFTIEAETSPANIVDKRNLNYQWQIDGVDFVDGTSTISRVDTYFYTTTIIDAYSGAGTVGSKSGFTNGDGSGAQNGFRYEAPDPSQNYFVELKATSNWDSTFSFVGVCDETHWDNLDWTSSAGVRMMWYHRYDFSYGAPTGSTIVTSKDFQPTNGNKYVFGGETYLPGITSDDIIGIVVNQEQGAVNFYVNGAYVCTIRNSKGAGKKLYVAVSDWFNRIPVSCEMLSSPSSYSSLYFLPTTDADQSLSIGGLSESTTVSGSKTPTLRIKTDQLYDSIVRCIVSNPDTRNSPVISNEVSFFIREPRNILNIETYDNSSIATLSQIDLDKEDITLTYATHPGNSICVYAPEKDVKVQVGLYGGKGSDNGSRKGGNGGLSFLEVIMERNVEYVFTGLFPFVNTPFFYRKGQLIGAVGGGGNAGSGSDGGSGGGVNDSGQKGGGNGGQVYSAGTLPANGILGSRTSLQAESPDTKATNQSGGRAISCTKGVYWRAQGFSACQDIGQSKFRISDGTLVTNSAEITRGYKDGYNLIQTSGAAESANSGHGGSGATGGNGGTSTGGGGGGSGYTDGSVTVRASLTGGWNSTSKVTISLNAGLIFWEGTYDSGITFSNDRLSFTRPRDNTQFPLGKQTYTSLLPSGNIYFDVQIDGGYTGWSFSLDQQNVSLVGSLVIYDADSITGYLGYFEHYEYYSGWYWRGVWTGVYLIDAGAVVEADGNNVTKFQFDYGNEIAAPATLTTGTYRMAINRNEKKLYMKRIGPDASSVGSITLPFTGNLRMAVLTQGWPGTYPSFGARILNNGIIYNGSGGLY